MNFLSPLAFLFALTIPVVIIFYLLKRKRTVRLVSSTLLWQKFLAESQANAPFQKLRRNWLLLLQILLLILAVLALARPYFSGQTSGGRMQVVILDASASMQSTDESPSRFEKARSEALKLVDALRDSDEMVVLQAAGQTEVKQSATSEKSSLRRALQNAAVTDSPTRLHEALKLAETLTRDRDDAEIHLLSDGAAPDLTEFEDKGLRVVYHRIGQRGENLAVTTLDVRTHPDDASKRAIFTTVKNFSTNAVDTELELLLDGQVLEVKSLTLAPREDSPQIFIANQAQDGVFTARISATDDLAADNQASIISLLPKPVKVLLVTEGNRFLEKALRAAPNVQLAVAGTLADAVPGADVVVLDSLSPIAWPQANVLAIHTANTNWFENIGKVEAPAIVDWKGTHALLRFVNFDNVQIAESMSVKTPTWATSLVDAQQTPLVLAGELDRQRIVWIGFDVLQSTWPLRISFPIFIANAVDWLNPATANSSQFTIRAGDPLRLGITEALTLAQVTLPDGSTRELKLDGKAGEIVFGETDRQGIYRLNAGTNQVSFVVNVMDGNESDTQPREELQLGQFARVEATTRRPANLEMWRWIAAAGLGVLLFEWWYYHRRTA